MNPLTTRFLNHVASLLRSNNMELEISEGRKYIKVISARGEVSKSAWCFIDKRSGDIFKAANWRAPAKHARGNVNTPESYQGYSWTGPYYLR
jgi:hypothetical protein